MENLNYDFAETLADNSLLESYQSNLDLYDFSSPGPGDEEEEAEETENAGEDKTSSEGTDDNDPPLDEDVVHSPLPPKSGGTP